MIENIKKHISQLGEINRALVHDLDVSRRIAAELGRDRDELMAERKILLRDAEAARARVVNAEQQLGVIGDRFQLVKQERDEFMFQLEESTEAMAHPFTAGVVDIGLQDDHSVIASPLSG
jgi:hypothetical protein